MLVLRELQALGGRGSPVQVSRGIWRRHANELQHSGDLFYTWQYDMRWAVQELRAKGLIEPAQRSQRGVWQLTIKGQRAK